MSAQSLRQHPATPGVFSRVVAGVDGTEPGYEAARQAARLVEPDGWLEVFTAVRLADASKTGWSAPLALERLEREAHETLETAARIAGPRAGSRLVNGAPSESLMHELARTGATVAVVGSHGHLRLTEIMIGGVVGTLLHGAPCSVLVARPPVMDAFFPRAIAAGVDGSPESEAALEAARALAARFEARLRVVCALRGKGVDAARVSLAAPDAELVDLEPLEALVEAARGADVLVVGSRGLHGIGALGSISERAAHRATCSVLVVRGQG